MNKPHVTLDNTIHIYYTWGQIRSIHYFNVCIIGIPTYQAIKLYIVIDIHAYTLWPYGVIKQDVCTYTCTCLRGSAHGYHNTFDEHTCMTL